MTQRYLPRITHQYAKTDGDKAVNRGKNHDIGIICNGRNSDGDLRKKDDKKSEDGNWQFADP